MISQTDFNRKSPFTDSYQVSQTQFPSICLKTLEHKHDPSLKVLSFEAVCVSLDEWMKNLKSVKLRESLIHKNLQKMLDFSSKGVQVNDSVETRYYVQSYFEDPKHTLFDEINRRKTHSDYFAAEELLALEEDLLAALTYLQSEHIYHGDLRPENIVYAENPRQSNKLIDRILDPLKPARIQWQHLKSKQACYSSPKIYSGLVNVHTKIKHNPFKSDTFSLGLVLLEAGLLKSVQEIFGEIEINFNKFMDLLQEFLERFQENPLLLKTVFWMLDLEEKTRKDASQIIKMFEDIHLKFAETKQFSGEERSGVEQAYVYQSEDIRNLNQQIQFQNFNTLGRTDTFENPFNGSGDFIEQEIKHQFKENRSHEKADNYSQKNPELFRVSHGQKVQLSVNNLQRPNEYASNEFQIEKESKNSNTNFKKFQSQPNFVQISLKENLENDEFKGKNSNELVNENVIHVKEAELPIENTNNLYLNKRDDLNFAITTNSYQNKVESSNLPQNDQRHFTENNFVNYSKQNVNSQIIENTPGLNNDLLDDLFSLPKGEAHLTQRPVFTTNQPYVYQKFNNETFQEIIPNRFNIASNLSQPIQTANQTNPSSSYFISHNQNLNGPYPYESSSPNSQIQIKNIITSYQDSIVSQAQIDRSNNSHNYRFNSSINPTVPNTPIQYQPQLEYSYNSSSYNTSKQPNEKSNLTVISNKTSHELQRITVSVAYDDNNQVNKIEHGPDLVSKELIRDTSSEIISQFKNEVKHRTIIGRNVRPSASANPIISGPIEPSITNLGSVSTQNEYYRNRDDRVGQISGLSTRIEKPSISGDNINNRSQMTANMNTYHSTEKTVQSFGFSPSSNPIQIKRSLNPIDNVSGTTLYYKVYDATTTQSNNTGNVYRG